MADYIKIPSDFFEREPIRTILERHGTDVVTLYLHMLCESYKNKSKGNFNIADIPLTDSVLQVIFEYDQIANKLKTLESYCLIKRNERNIEVIKFWVDTHDRNSARYRNWRMSVFKRDNFTCKSCGSKNDLQAHHIKAWKSNKELRYEVKNGITLCRKCHLKAHGGCWKNG